jgi:hypothetical protein
MLAKEVMQNGIDIDNRIKEQLAFYKQWEVLADEFEEGVLLNIVEDARTELIDLILMKKNIEDIIMSNNNRDQRQILRMRYLENLSWQCIAEELFEEVDWTKEQHHKALKKIHLKHSCECCHAEEE